MNCNEIIAQLQAISSEKYKANVVKMGIPEHSSIGVSTGDIRTLAKKLEKSNPLAMELWQTGYHEAKLLAVLLFDKKNTSLEEVKRLMSQVISWDLCDHLCKNLIIKLKGYEELIPIWVSSEHLYEKRAAFTLIASGIIHEKNLTNDTLDEYLRIIQTSSDDDREHVKKAVSWALREIGKKDFNYNEKAILLACELMECGTKAQSWIGKNALKELETLVKAEERGRLITSKSKMGKQVC